MTKKKKGKVPSSRLKSSSSKKNNFDSQDRKAPSRFLSERMNRAIGRIMEKQDFKNMDEANRFLKKHVMGKKLDNLLEEMEYDPVEEAQELAFKAMETDNPGEVFVSTLEALVFDPDCIDALMLASKLTASSDWDLIEKIKLVITRAEKKMGKKFINEHRGQFWGVVETRPFMRALDFLAEMFHETGQIDNAIREYEKILGLNPHDNQGIRYQLIGLYLEEKNLSKVRKLLKEYKYEPSAAFLWGHVLERFLSGDLDEAERVLHKAEKRNPNVLGYLTGIKRIPDESPSFYSPGEESEAIVCFEEIGQAWLKDPAAIEWLKSVSSRS